jgi:CheY-like chemotaxis protein
VSRPVLLLVDDNPEDISFFRRAAAKAEMGCRLIVAEDGQKAIERLSSAAGDGEPAEARPTHVLLDLKLPRKSGLEVLAWIRNRGALRAMPVIILTSSEVQSDMQRARSLGIDAYLVKPLTSTELVDVARRIAAQWKIEGGLPELIR